jgi:hypothetical protein
MIVRDVVVLCSGTRWRTIFARGMSKVQSDDVKKKLQDMPLFQQMLAVIETAEVRRKCDQCNIHLMNVMELAQHMRDVHKDGGRQDAQDDSVQGTLVSLADSQKMMTATLVKSQMKISDAVLKLVERDKTGSIQVSKARFPPTWIGGDFDRWKTDVLAWTKNNKDDEYTKSQDLIESLKKNPKVKQYVIDVLIDSTKVVKTVEKILELMAAKFARTAPERLRDCLRK